MENQVQSKKCKFKKNMENNYGTFEVIKSENAYYSMFVKLSFRISGHLAGSVLSYVCHNYVRRPFQIKQING